MCNMLNTMTSTFANFASAHLPSLILCTLQAHHFADGGELDLLVQAVAKHGMSGHVYVIMHAFSPPCAPDNFREMVSSLNNREQQRSMGRWAEAAWGDAVGVGLTWVLNAIVTPMVCLNSEHV